jgi:hypothetical protein
MRSDTSQGMRPPTVLVIASGRAEGEDETLTVSENVQT